MKSRTLSVSIHCDSKKVYGFVSNPQNLPKWAKAFCHSIKKSNGEWVIETSQGLVKFRFAPKNDSGILDHYVGPSPGVEVFVPMRVVPNGHGCEIIFTLFQQSGMSDENYAKDAEMVEQDLKNLQAIMETVEK